MRSLKIHRPSSYRLLLAALTGMIVMLAVACGSDGPAKGPKLGTPFTLSVGSFVEVDVGDENVRVDFMGLQADSRCASGVTCITAGQAEIFLALTGEDGQRRTFPVNVPPKGSVISEVAGYSLRLEHLLPDPPPLGVDETLYRAELVLTRVP
jgi:hypothetical protein